MSASLLLFAATFSAKDCTEVYRTDTINANDLTYIYLDFKVRYLMYLDEKYFKQNDTFSTMTFYCSFLITSLEIDLKQKLFWDLLFTRD